MKTGETLNMRDASFPTICRRTQNWTRPEARAFANFDIIYLKGRKVRVHKFSRQKFSRKLIPQTFVFVKFSKTTKFAKFIAKIDLYGK